MKISYNWLKEYLKSSLDADTMSSVLTDIGLEVEGVEQYESLKGGLEGFVTGKVITCEQHPNADKLHITTVDVGGPNLLNIVCGAPNVAVGQKVIVAVEGVIVYKGEERFKIKKSKLRGAVSEGMICAEDELGVGDSHAGILVLPDSTPIGMPAADYFGIVNDTVFEIGITANRSDAICHLGVARDLAAAIKIRNLGDVTFQWPDVEGFKVDNNDLPVSVTVEDNEGCLRYSGITINNIKVGTSPEWLQNRLKSIGVRPINNIVDVSNYVLFEYGQPLHTFDADAITGHKIIVKKAVPESKFVTLDHTERTLSGNDLMICNAAEPMCIAGVFGGEKSGVTSATTSIFIESAYFNPVTIRKTSKLHSLKTDASFRYERGTDPYITITALKRAALLIKELAGGEISSSIVDIYPVPVPFVEIYLKYSEVDKLIGEKLSRDTIAHILEALQIKINSRNDEGMLISVPPFKADVKTTSDIVEEILRIYGYNKIESGLQMQSSISYTHKPDQESLYNRVADYLVSNNFNEIMTNSLSSTFYYEGSKWFKEEETVNILNPLSKELGVMRQSLVFSGLESLAYNINRKQSSLKFFEFGTVYKLNSQPKSDQVTDRYTEKKDLAIFVTGNQHADHWNYARKEVDYYFLNGYIVNILRLLGIDTKLVTSNECNSSVFSAGQTYQINGSNLYTIGIFKEELTAMFNIAQPVWGAIIEWDLLVALAKKNKVIYKEVSRFPEVRRDLALVLEKSISYADIEKLAFRVNKHLLKSVNLFDVYEGDKIEQGKKSYAVSFMLQDENKTLTDKEIESFMDKLSKMLEQELGARIRK